MMCPQLLLHFYQTAQPVSIAARWCDTLPVLSYKPASDAQTALRWGMQHFAQRRFDKALKNFEAALQTYTRDQNLVGVGKSLNGLSAVYLEAQEYERSLAYSQASVSVLEDTGTPEDLALAVYQLGVSHLQLANLSEAEYYLDQALTRYNALGDVLNENRVVLHLGLLYAQRQEFMFALACYESVLDDLLKFPFQETQALVLEVLSLILRLSEATGHTTLETAPSKKLVEYYSDKGYAANIAEIFQQLGKFHESQTRYGLAFECYAHALQTIPPVQLA
ncbi:MAG: tetratricopeptide repeat protein [Cyanobacteria bacterium J06639_14]